ncbi:hypothetical protein KFE25_007217 [Diacronema lutheri]|uniref:STAS domain-containing protein n=2 Tax=Diacronema lutheri TaxID=2081491 RepID=A0A8J5XUG5_DIALT|nr:hypothetical protein KFE25_007217 [Diacronema lutheri]
MPAPGAEGGPRTFVEFREFPPHGGVPPGQCSSARAQEPSPAHLECTEKWVDRVHGPGRQISRQKSTGGGPIVVESPHEAAVRVLTPPCWAWLSRYSRADLRGDVLAGLTVSVVLVPQAVAYALLADLPPVNGLYTSLVPLLVYAATGTSRHMSVGPFALMSIITRVLAHDVIGLDAPVERRVDTAAAIAIAAGTVQLAMGALGLGLGAAFLSDTSVAGFTTASALIIAGSQLQHLLGVPMPSGNLARKLGAAARVVLAGEANGYAAAVTLASLGFMLGIRTLGRRCCPRVPLFEQLLAVVVFTAGALALGLPVPRVGDDGEVPSGLPAPRVPSLGANTLEQNLALLQAGLTAGLTSFLLSTSIARTFALIHGYAIDANGELLALGLSNVAGGFFGAYPLSGSLSRSALCSSVGGRTPLHGAVQAAVVGGVLLGCTALFAPLPYGVLAAIIFVALSSLLDFALPALLWQTSRSDFWLWAIAFGGTVLFGVQPGLALSVGSSLCLLVARQSRPACEVLGRLPGTELFRDVRRYPAALCTPGLLVFRFHAPLHFANAEFFCAQLRELLRRRASRACATRALVLDCSAMTEIDFSANSALRGLLEELRAQNVALLLAATGQALTDRLRAFGTLGGPLLSDEQLYTSVGAAVLVAAGRPAAEADGASPTATHGRDALCARTLEEARDGGRRASGGDDSPARHADAVGAQACAECDGAAEPFTSAERPPRDPGALLRSASAVMLGMTERLTMLTPGVAASVEQRRGGLSLVPTLEPSDDGARSAFARVLSRDDELSQSSGDELASEHDLRFSR